jgi:hypothetical protein
MQKLMLLAVVGLLSLPLMAQESTKSELFGGYQYLRFGSTTTNGVSSTAEAFNGWNGSVTYNFSKYVGAVGDVGGGYATINGVSTHVYTLTGGPVVSPGTERTISPFAHALFGLARVTTSQSVQGVTSSASNNGFAVMVGGGMDARITKAISVRLIQADWLYYRFGQIAGNGPFSQSNNLRLSIGIVYRFVPFS